MKNKSSTGGTGTLVYSTAAGGRTCPMCRQALAQCICKQGSNAPATGDGIARVGRQTKGRGGKVVTVIEGLHLDSEQLATLGKQLKASCGTGGTVKDGVIEIQGDHGDRIVSMLKALGHRVKRAGG